MEKARSIWIGLLIVSAAAVGAEPAGKPDKSVMVMFQDAQYQEQTVGDLDKAIELYQQVVQEAGEVEKLAARATFQLGMCYMKKGDNAKAVEEFKKVVKQYPAQKELAEKASKQLEKIQPSLQLSPAPWIDGEVMELRLIRPAGNEYGKIIYSAQSEILDRKNVWQIASHLYVTEGSASQYTLVKTDANTFAPSYGQTTNWMGNFIAEYSQGNVKLTTSSNDKQKTRDIPVGGVVYDNEQAAYLIRRMPLAENYEGSFPIFSVQAGATVECRIKVLAVEDINVPAGAFKCFKTDLSIYADGVRSLQHTLWFSADDHKYMVKYDVGGAATMELAKVWQKNKQMPLVFENSEPAFSVAVPSDWRFYSYQSPGPQYSLQMLPPDIKAWAVLVWQKRGEDPDSASAKTISKADSEKLKGAFKNYLIRSDSSKEVTINGCQAAQYIADYQQGGSGLQTYDKPKDMVEYRTYLVDKTEVYWFVFRVEKEKFEQNKSEFDLIVNSFKINSDAAITMLTKFNSPQQTIWKDSFEQGNENPDGWEKGNDVEGVEYFWDKNTGSDGKSSLCLKKTAQKYFPISQWTRNIEYAGGAKKIQLSTKVRALKAYKAVLDVLFLDEKGEWIKHEWAAYIGAKEENDPPANHNWKEYSGTVEIPDNTKTIVIGLQMYGPGTVWFDELQVSYLNETTVSSKPDKLRAEDLIAEGWKLWKERKLAEAEKKFEEAIAADPTNDGAYQGLGWAQLNQGKKNNAKASFEKCVELNPKNSAALNGLGWIAHGQNDKDQAIQWWEKAVKAQPGATASLSGLTQVYMERGDYPNAVKYYEMWLKAEPDNQEAKEGLEKTKKMLTEQEKLIQKAVDAAKGWLALLDNGQYAESWNSAAPFFKKAVTKGQWKTSAQTVRSPLGDLISREVLSQNYTQQVPGGPDGEYVIIQFKASYSNKKDAIETVTPMLDSDGQWRVSGYFIK